MHKPITSRLVDCFHALPERRQCYAKQAKADDTVKDVENYIIVGGSDEIDGEINWNIKTDDYRIISGGREGADIGDQQVLTTNVEITLNWFVELMLALVSLTLFLGSV